MTESILSNQRAVFQDSRKVRNIMRRLVFTFLALVGVWTVQHFSPHERCVSSQHKYLVGHGFSDFPERAEQVAHIQCRWHAENRG